MSVDVEIKMKTYTHSAVVLLLLLLCLNAKVSALPAVRAIDDQQLTALSEPEILTQEGHQGRIAQVAFANHGRLLISSSDDGSIRSWDIATEKLLALLRVKDHVFSPPSIAVSPDGRLLAAKLANAGIEIWDLSKWQRISTCARPYFGHFFFGKDSSSLILFGAGKVVICRWNGSPDVEIERDRTIRELAIDQSGTTIAISTGDEFVHLYDLRNGKLQSTLNAGDARILSIDCSPIAELLVSGGEDRTIRLWNLATGKMEILATGASPTLSVQFGADGRLLMARNYDDQINIWNVGTRRLVGSVHSSPSSPVSLVSLDDRYVGIAKSKAISILDLTTGETKQIDLKTGGAFTIAYSAENKLLAIGDGNDIVTVDSTNRATRTYSGRHRRKLRSIGISDDGLEIAAAETRNLVLWNLEAGTMRTASVNSDIPGWSQLEFSPDRRTLAIHADQSLESRTTTLWDIAQQKDIVSISDKAGWPILFSYSGTYFADVDQDGSARVLDRNGKTIIKLRGLKDTWALAFSPDEKFVAAVTRTNEITVWPLARAVPFKLLGTPTGGNHLSFASSDLLIRFKRGKATEAWNLKVKSKTRIPPGIAPYTRNWIASAVSPEQVNILDLDSHLPVMSGSMPSEAIMLAVWSSRRSVVATLSQNGNISVWKLDPAGAASKLCSFYLYEDGSFAVLDSDGKIANVPKCTL